jgi:hypothetical protein
MRKDAADPSRSTPDSESGRKKKYNAPQFTRLTPEEAKAHADSEGLAGESRRETLLEWIAELEMRPTKSDPTQEPQRPKAAWVKSSRVGFFLRVCAGRRDSLFSNRSACRCALSAFVRFSEMRIVFHRSCSLGKAAGFKSAHVWGLDQLRLWKNEPPKRRLLPVRQSSTQFVSVTPRPPTSIRLMTREYAPALASPRPTRLGSPP